MTIQGLDCPSIRRLELLTRIPVQCGRKGDSKIVERESPMRFHNRLLPIVTITGSSLMVGCGGNNGGSCGYGSSYGSSGGCSGPAGITGDGYYEGTLTGQGNAQALPVVAIIADNGDGTIAGQDGTYYRLNVSLPRNDVTGTYFEIGRAH